MRDILTSEAPMDEQNQAFREEACKHTVVHPGPLSIEDDTDVA
jgi:hypothetical protein